MTIDIGIVGFGWMGSRVARVIEANPDVTLAGSVEPDPATRTEFESTHEAPAYPDISTFLNYSQPDGLVIASPNAAHYEQARYALNEGIDVLVEKPFVTDLADGIALVERAANRPASLFVGYHRRFHPGFQTIREKIQHDDIGQPVALSMSLGQNWLDPNRDKWRTGSGADGGGMLYDTGSHLLEAISWALDAKPDRVGGTVDTLENGVDINSALAGKLSVENTTIPVSITFCGESTRFIPDEQFVVWGEEGRMNYLKDHTTGGPPERLTVCDEEGTEEREFTDIDSKTLTRRKLDAFFAAVRGEPSKLTTGEEALELAAFREAARRAAETGEQVSVPAYRAEVSRDR